MSVIVPVVVNGCETWYLTLMKEQNRMLRRISVPKRKDGEHCIMRSF
jgi:hypothetical protein